MRTNYDRTNNSYSLFYMQELGKNNAPPVSAINLEVPFLLHDPFTTLVLGATSVMKLT